MAQQHVRLKAIERITAAAVMGRKPIKGNVLRAGDVNFLDAFMKELLRTVWLRIITRAKN